MLTREKKNNGDHWVIYEDDKSYTLNTRTGVVTADPAQETPISQVKFDNLWNRATDAQR